MKKFKTLKALIFAISMVVTPLAVSTCKAAQDHSGESEIDHKVLAGAVTEFKAYGDALEAFTKNFFGVIPNKFTKAQFINLGQKLSEMVHGIKERLVKYKETVKGAEVKQILAELEKLAVLLAASSTKLLNTLQKSLGTRNFLAHLKRLGDEESKQVPQVYALQKAVGGLLAKHAPKATVDEFAQFVKSVEYSLSYPSENMMQVLSIARKYSSLK